MATWVTQEDRDEMIDKFTRNRKKKKEGTVKLTGQKPVEVRFLTPEELEERRKGIEFGERVPVDRSRFRANAPVVLPSRRGQG